MVVFGVMLYFIGYKMAKMESLPDHINLDPPKVFHNTDHHSDEIKNKHAVKKKKIIAYLQQKEHHANH